MNSNPIKRDFSKNQIKILRLLFEKEYLQNELQEALKTTAPNLHYHLSRLEGYNLIIKKTLHEVGSAKINRISLNPSAREYIRKSLGYKNKKSTRNNASKIPNSSNKPPRRVLKKNKNNYYQISIIVFLLCLTGIIVSSTLLFSTPLKIDDENSDFQELTANADIFTQVSQSKTLELTANADIFTQTSKTNNVDLTANADIFTQTSKTNNVELTADADVFTQKTKTSDINVYDGSGATPFLRLGLYEFTYDSGGYLSEIYVRFNLPKIEKISSMMLQLTYWEGYPIEADDYYDVNVSLVSNDWVEGNTVWTERPEYLGTSSVIYLHNPGLESEVYLNITNLVEGITENMITVHLCPNNLSRIRFPAPFYSSESYEITPKLILEYEEPVDPSIKVYDYSVSIPFLRLGLYEYTYDEGGYLSEMYLRFSLLDIEKIGSMILRLSYWEGYPIEADSYYEVNASLVRNNWVEETTTWSERPEYLGTSALIYLHNPSLQSEINLDLTSLVEGITETMITIRLCPHNLTRIRFPAPFKSSELDEMTPRLILEYTTTPQPMVPNTAHIILIILLVIFGLLTAITLSGLIYKMRKHEVREIPAVITQDNVVPIIKQENQAPIVKEEISEPAKPLKERRKKQILCPHCGAATFKGWIFCITCGKHIKTEKDSGDTFEFLGGFIISLIGGLTSLLLGFGIAFVYPEIAYYMGDSIMILQTIIIIGGIVSIFGSIVVFFKPKLGGAIVMTGGFIAGINIITILGANRIFKKLKS